MLIVTFVRRRAAAHHAIYGVQWRLRISELPDSYFAKSRTAISVNTRKLWADVRTVGHCLRLHGILSVLNKAGRDHDARLQTARNDHVFAALDVKSGMVNLGSHPAFAARHMNGRFRKTAQTLQIPPPAHHRRTDLHLENTGAPETA
ncbi:hypothetical protein [Yoonia sp.]|uniref:hypothetical protein n=1 Tax=Yoonia sp. TaxID=2212373 RepID=UPI002DFAECEB|nr:hypothetical protein [Yoonia sp.]